LFLPLAFAMPTLAGPPGIDNLAMLPWYRETSFLILAGLAILLIAFLSRLAWLHSRLAAFLRRHDLLTGLSNRAVFEAAFQHVLSSARAENTC
jgi:small neutral amino acid transporter SnatA (MarC family)